MKVNQMFKFYHKTDLEKLLFAETYIKELRKEIKRQKELSTKAVENLNAFMEDVRALGKRGARLISYKQEMMNAHKKNRTLKSKLTKMEHKNYLLRKQVRELKTQQEEKFDREQIIETIEKGMEDGESMAGFRDYWR